MLNLNLGGYTHLKPDNCIKYAKSIFPDNTIYFKLDDGFPKSQKSFGRQAYEPIKIWCRLNTYNDVFELMFAVDALRRHGYNDIQAVIPYLPGAQQDRPFEGQPFSLKIIAKILNDLRLDKISAVDCHSPACESLIDNLVDWTNKGFINDVLLELWKESIKDDKLNFISPDAGAAKKICQTLSDIKNPNIIVCQKERDTKTNKLTKTVVPKIDNDWPCLIVDDIVLAGNSAKNLVDQMRLNGNNNVTYLACTHSVFPKGEETIADLGRYFKRIFISNSRSDEYMGNGGLYNPLVKQISLF